MNYNELLPGNVIHQKKFGFDHQAIIYDGFYVYENSPGRGEHLSRLDEFIKQAGNSLRITTYPPLQRQIHLNRINQQLRIRRAWSVLNNCQDTVTRITEGHARSHQRTEMIWMALFAFVGV